MSTPATKINADTTFYQPPNHDASELIILCTWLGASEKHIAKYMALYQALTPSTPILLIESHVGTITRPYPAQRQRMGEALAILQRTLSSSSPSRNTTPKILIHTFSNGGSNSATQLLLAYREKTHRALPLQGMICDSGPAKGEYWKSYNSMIQSLPKSMIFRLVGGFMAHFILLWMGINSRYLGRYPIFEVLIRETLVDEDIVGVRERGEGDVQGTGRRRRRRINYVWSKEDEMVEWMDVVEHGEEAKGKGWEVMRGCGWGRSGVWTFESVLLDKDRSTDLQ
ncbi:hypothetical protein K505DRAFT_412088 [Melanomma pulvis-pyrius CBS 109.77]|uniref:Indole-diterpene biosynthesis protein-like protein PaxU n=1 Tax=Melanomma pulvis-pyrius CBS 109.77 TaxID=1314802 RepID=A0A6A6WQJ4_9PLEO|nr:hypothetical protein K505DRAFT_412088 [Melanomma pulvis-pyrius CBS 109.77]